MAQLSTLAPRRPEAKRALQQADNALATRRLLALGSSPLCSRKATRMGQLWIEPVGELIIARIRGEPTAELLRECQDQVLLLMRESGRGKVLYDVLEMDPPPVDVPWAQRELDAALGGIALRRAIVVPNAKLAYLARLAFGEGDYRVFYNDMVAAVRWLTE